MSIELLKDARAQAVALFGTVVSYGLGWIDLIWEVAAATADTWFPMLSVLLIQVPNLLAEPELGDGEIAFLAAIGIYVVIYAIRFEREASDEIKDETGQ